MYKPSSQQQQKKSYVRLNTADYKGTLALFVVNSVKLHLTAFKFDPYCDWCLDEWALIL